MGWTRYLIAIVVVPICAGAGPSFRRLSDEDAPLLEAMGEPEDVEFLTGPVPAATVCGPCAVSGTPCDVIPGACVREVCIPPQWFVYGWFEQGITLNVDSPPDRFNGPNGFNDRSNDYQANQFYVTAGRRVDPSRCCWDLGARVDLLYGSDYIFTQARGLETQMDGSPKWNSGNGPRAGGVALYGLALPQLYAELFLPIDCGLTVQFGHFYTTLGYEAVQAPDNFFYSHTYMMLYGEPRTHTGVLARYNIAPCWEINAGVTNGWDNFSNDNGELAFLGGVSWKACDGSSAFSFQLHTGGEANNGDRDRTVYTLIYREELMGGLTYVFQHDLGHETNAAVNRSGIIDARWYGITQYLFCPINCCTELGLRMEWFRDEHNARVLAMPTPASAGSNYFNLTLGLNWRPVPRLLLRPELRWDSSDVTNPLFAPGGVYDAGRKKDQLTLALSLITHF